MVLVSPRIVIAGLRGGAGKTFLTVGITALLYERGYTVAPFKKGPDFIDTAWLSMSSGSQCFNLDMFLMTDDQIKRSFTMHSAKADIAVIEGNRGLYDGVDIDGSCSTANLSKLLDAAVILVVDVTMATRTVAAIVKGCQVLDPDVNIKGVIINRVAGPRQKALISGAIERYCGIPVIGSLPKLRDNPFPERHMGLVPFHERAHAEKAIATVRSVVGDSVDIDALWKIAHDVRPLEGERESVPYEKGESLEGGGDPLRIGVIRDQSFWFYYPENLKQLQRMGAILIEINSLQDADFPDVDGLYIGGGFPETQARALAENRKFRCTLREKIEAGLPVYAECGGLLYLGESLIVEGSKYPMVGVVPLQFIMEGKPQGHGYTILEVTRPNPYFRTGKIIKGHEFHYSRAIATGTDREMKDFVFTVRRGNGIGGDNDGFCKKNLLATYTHIHGAGDSEWAESFIKRVRKVRNNIDMI
ncbi:MAG TPA: hydrogenobyrinic acid a,c-diamide synthase (glutamine-hydrolyzing) [Syntrophales bacterium]|nr:hydrogenobyrinic acid a,c-diamide synthase (glutamine-hydrolyzing) [Syntrophales bacterium]HPQ44894.1 hydrogenobyrinic acid a,c-diamide synthase (glutamine-hydrolyzing) [Syntrophales bacterium]